MRRSNYILFAIFAITSLWLAGCSGSAQHSGSKSVDNDSGAMTEQSVDKAPTLPAKGVTWINSEPKSLEQLRGQVVLVDFWEYTCINCIRSFPYEKQLYKRYHDAGLEILGIHDPEFDIAYKTQNVRQAVKRFELPWPVANDPKFAIWNAYDSHTWPNFFLVDQQGNLVGHWSGEGHDAQIERAIQKQLAKGALTSDSEFDASKYPVEETNWFTPDCGDMTGETYVGKWYGRGALQGQGGYQDGVRRFDAEQMPEDGKFVLTGRWQTAKNGTTFRGSAKAPPSHPPEPINAGGEDHPNLTLKYHAREIYGVMHTAHARSDKGTENINQKTVRLYLTQDGKYLTKENAAADTQFDDQGRSFITVNQPRMYYLVLNPEGDDGSHVLTLWPSEPGLTINSFTFGNNCSIDFAHLYAHQPMTPGK